MYGIIAKRGGKTGRRKVLQTFTIFTDVKSCVFRYVFLPFVRGIK